MSMTFKIFGLTPHYKFQFFKLEQKRIANSFLIGSHSKKRLLVSLKKLCYIHRDYFIFFHQAYSNGRKYKQFL